MTKSRYRKFQPGALPLLLALALMAPTALAGWFVQRLPAPPAAEAQAILARPGEGDGQPDIELRTVELLGAGDEWHACGRGLPTDGAILHYTDAGGQRRRLPIRETGEQSPGRQAYDVVLALDASLSMRNNDPDDLRLAAWRRFLALARENQAIRTFSLLVFRRDARMIVEAAPPKSIDREQEDDMARQLHPRGGTSFDVPFAAIDQLLARLPDAENAKRAVIFLSDGEPLGRYREGHKDLARHKCPIYTIGLSEEADADLLGRIASESAGLYFEAPTANQLEDIFVDIFRILSLPEDVVRISLSTAGGKTIPLLVDPGMRNPNLHLASLVGTVKAGLDDAALDINLTDGRTHSQRLPATSDGRHTLKLRGDGRLSLRLQAGTPHGLRTLGVPMAGAVDTPFTLAAWLTEDLAVEEIEVHCHVRTPGGRRLPWRLQANAFGLFIGQWHETGEAGAYEVEVSLTGRLQGRPLQRRYAFVFRRDGRRGPSPYALVKTTLEVPFATIAPASEINLPGTPAPPESVPPGMAGSLWTSADEVRVELPPGGETSRTVTMQVDGPQDSPAPTATLDWPPLAGLEVNSRLLAAGGRQTAIELTIVASPAAAGECGQGTLRLAAGALNRELPLFVRVSRPQLRGELDPFAVDQTTATAPRSARAGLRLWLEGDGECDVHMVASHPEIGPLPRLSRLTTEMLELPLELPLTPDGPRLWQGEITVDGPGLARLSLPYSFVTPAKPVAATGGPNAVGGWLWLALILAVLLALALLLAGLRGDRRAWFVLGSAIVHALILLAVVPRSRLRDIADQLSGTIAVTGTVTVIEETVAAESSQLPPGQAQAEASAAAKAAAELAATSEAVSSALPPATVETAPESPTATAMTPSAVERPEWQPQATPESELAPPPRRVADSRTTQTARAIVATVNPATSDWQPPVAEKARDLSADSANPLAATPDVNRRAMPDSPPPSLAELGDPAPAPVAVGQRRRGETAPTPAAQPANPAVAAAPQPRGQGRTAASFQPGPSGALEVDGTLSLAPTVPLPTAAPVAPPPSTLLLPEVAARTTPVDEVGRRSLAVVVPTSAPLAAPTAVSFPAGGRNQAPAAAAVSRPLSTPAIALPTSPAPRIQPAVSPRVASPNERGEFAPPTADSRPAAPPGKRGRAAPAVVAAAAIASPTVDKVAFESPFPAAGMGGARTTPALAATLPSGVSPTLSQSDGGTVGEVTMPLPTPSAASLAAARPRSASTAPAGPARPLPMPRRMATTTAAPSRPPLAMDSPAPLPELERPPLAEPALHGHPRTEMLAEALGGAAGQWRRTFANLKYAGDWDANQTAMLHLAHQFERRTGSVFPFGSRTLATNDPELRKAPFLFMSGHLSFAFDDREAQTLREYLQAGGYLWINDSTDIGDEVFDTAVRRQLAHLFPDAELRPIPMEHPIFSGPYDLGGGFRNFRVPPGDKFRTDHLEGLWIDERLAVVYTRNDYGDGLEIDLKTAPAMLSLTDLSAVEMQEASLQMGINLATYFIFQGRPTRARLAASLPPPPTAESASFPAPPPKSSLLDEPGAWQPPPDDSPDYLPVTKLDHAGNSRNGLTIAFAADGNLYQPWRSKAIVQRQGELPIDRQTVIVMDVYSHLAAGARLALAFGGDGPVPYIETTAMFIRPGDNSDLVFDLRQPIFKTEQSDWRIGVDLPDDFRPHTLYLLVYPQGPDGTVECHNLRLAQPQKTN